MSNQTNKRVDALKQKRAQIDAQLTRLNAQTKADARKADTRRKILIGAVIMQEMASIPKVETWVRELLAERLTKDRDRVLFGLAPLPSKPSNEA